MLPTGPESIEPVEPTPPSRKAFVYRVYPSKGQQRRLARQLEECRWLWNTLLAERKQAWEDRQERVDYYAQKQELPVLKASERPSLSVVHSQVLQDVVLRLKNAFAAFFRRLKAGETPGYPRFRGVGRYDSLTFPQVPVGCALKTGDTDHPKDPRLVVSKVGRIKIVLHRPLEGTPKTATIRRTARGKWFVSISCEWEPTPLPPTGQEVGIDVGLTVFAMPSQGDLVENPRVFRTEEHALAKVQRQHQVALDAHQAVRATLTKQVQQAHPDVAAQAVWTQVSQDPDEQQAWKRRQRRRTVVARVHERIRWRRDNFTHQASRTLVNQDDLIAVEDLSVRSMVRNHHLAKSIHDAAWTQFTTQLAYKAAWAGRQYVAVDPAYTSQECSGCGWRNQELTLADRVFHCLNPARPECGLVLDRDVNAARNILARGKTLLTLLAARAEQAGQRDSDVQDKQGIGMTMPGFAQEAPGF